MPLKVMVTSGLQLPGSLPGKTFSAGEYASLSQAFRDPATLRKYSTNGSYTSDDRAAVLDGLALWNSERSVSFSQTHSSADADIIVFFSDTIENEKTGVCAYPYAYRQPNIIHISMNKKKEFQPDVWKKRLRAVAAHEFGHAFGLEHTNDSKDIMYPTETGSREESVGYGSRSLSEADKAQLRQVYSNTPGVWLLSVTAR